MKFEDSEYPTVQMKLSQNEELKFEDETSSLNEKEIKNMLKYDISTININEFYKHISEVISLQHKKKQRRNKNNKVLALFLFQYFVMKETDSRKWANHINSLLSLYPVINKTTLIETIKIGKYLYFLKQIQDLKKLYDMTYDEIRNTYHEHISNIYSEPGIINKENLDDNIEVINSEPLIDEDSKIVQKLTNHTRIILTQLNYLKLLKGFDGEIKNLKERQNIIFATGMKELIINTIKEYILYLDENIKIKNNERN